MPDRARRELVKSAALHLEFLHRWLDYRAVQIVEIQSPAVEIRLDTEGNRDVAASHLTSFAPSLVGPKCSFRC